jgi:hypothetical protein
MKIKVQNVQLKDIVVRNNEKSFRLVDYIEDLCKDPRMQKVLDDMKNRQQESPAKFARQYDMTLTNLHMSLKAYSMMIAQDIAVVTEMCRDYERDPVKFSASKHKKRFEESYESLKSNIRLAAKTLNEVDDRERMLDEAVVAEELEKIK